MHLSEDLPLNEKTKNHTGNQKEGHISQGDLQAYKEKEKKLGSEDINKSRKADP